jgi:hypothetical protein
VFATVEDARPPSTPGWPTTTPTEIGLNVQGELGDAFNGNERVMAVVIQRPYMRQVYVPYGWSVGLRSGCGARIFAACAGGARARPQTAAFPFP